MTLERNIAELSAKVNTMIGKSSNVYRESLELKKKLAFDFFVSKSVAQDKKTFGSLRSCLDHIKNNRGIINDSGNLQDLSAPEHVTVYLDSMQDFETIELDTPNLDIIVSPKLVFANKIAFLVSARDVRIDGGIYAFDDYSPEHEAIVSKAPRTFVNNIKLINTSVWGGLRNIENPPIIYEEYRI